MTVDLMAFARAVANGDIRVIDLTQTLSQEFPTIVLPPELGQCAPFRMEEVSRYDERGPAWYWNNISLGEHTGTHFDAPIHWISGKDLPNNAVDTINVAQFIAPAVVIDCSKECAADPDFALTIPFVEQWEARHGKIEPRSWVLLNPPYPAHFYMHGKGRFGLQCLTNLDLLPPKGALIIAAPLKIKQGSGSPLRVLALVAGGNV
jgi:kynurenine formamidase